MVEPFEVEETSKKLEGENIKFRSFLKNRADGDELDAHFLNLHNELFPTYDCSKCRNCCKTYDTYLEETEIKSIAEFLGQTENDFKNEHLIQTEEGYKIKGKPCSFLCADGICQIQEFRPSACRDFPFTDKPERLFSLFGILEFAEVCPVVLEILEELKKIYGFRNRV